MNTIVAVIISAHVHTHMRTQAHNAGKEKCQYSDVTWGKDLYF